MSVHVTEKEKVFANRRKRILKQIKGQAALFVAPPVPVKSRDQEYSYFPNPDFFYLTGFEEPECALLLLGTAKGPRTLLYLRERRELEEQWTGERLGLKRAKRRFLVDEIREIQNLESDLPRLLKGFSTLHYTAGNHGKIDALVWELFKNPVGPRVGQLHSIKDARLITSEMRLIKDKTEIRNIQHAVDITARALRATFKELKNCASEQHAASVLESYFSKFGADGHAFQSIVATGKNATVLHHRPGAQPLWKRELVLFDVGALYRGYAGDLTRTIPASGTFTAPQAAVYDAVYEGLRAGIAKCFPGGCLDDIHQTTVRVLTSGLVNLGILKGNVSQLVAQRAYSRYYMHQTSHWLGLDVHDISPSIAGGEEFSSALWPLQAGMVFTVEPGLYFRHDDETVPKAYRGIGIRLEENVLITGNGHELLSRSLPVTRADIEEMLR